MSSIYSCFISHTTLYLFKITDELQMIFDMEGWSLDSSVTLKSGLEEFPYEEVFSVVSN